MGPRNPNKKIQKNNKGQSLVEFILLLALVLMVSRGFLYIVNAPLANIWEKAIDKVINYPMPTNERHDVNFR